jgi:SAM-dependent methyltransferase
MVRSIKSQEDDPGRRKDHWEGVYRATAETCLSWYQDEPRLSLELIDAVSPAETGRIIDVGGGASILVDMLLERRFEKIAVLDISDLALTKARARLGSLAGRVEWIVGDITLVDDVGTFDVWHDRAVFHFLTDASDRRKYADLARRTIPEGGHVIIATFAKDGPNACSGLDVNRYDADSLSEQLDRGFSLVRAAREVHTTPWKTSQPFFYGVFRRERG